MAVYNRIYTSQKWAEVNKYNKDLMEDFLTELKSQKKKQGTIDQYRNDLRILFIYILENLDNKPICKLKKKAFRGYILWLQDRNMSNARVNRLMSALRSMLEYASNEEDYEDEIEINYASKVKGLQKERVREIVFLEDEEVRHIVDTLIYRKQYSQALLCAFLYDSCARKNEIHQVKRSDISLDSNICKSYVIAKRGKKYRPLYNDLTKKAFRIFEQNVPDTNDCLWLTYDGKPASYETIYSWVVSWRNILDEPKDFNVHSFRHSCANNLENGTHYLCKKLGKKFDLQVIQKLMNHSDIGTTQSYLQDRSEDELIQAFDI